MAENNVAMEEKAEAVASAVENTPTPTWDDGAEAKKFLDEREARIKADKNKPFDPDALLEVRHLRKAFPLKKTITGKVTSELVAVDDISFVLKPGETLGIVGESGCGKTTMGRTILKLHPSNGGQIIFDGKDITNAKSSEMREIRKQMQIIFQDPYSSLPPRSTVGGILSEPVMVHNIVPKSEVKDYVLNLMDKCGLRDYYYERY
ncbi:MAG: ATP-binding cassette domain-containing protein, partial [Clostridia bacterium]|nr:ATP-binding cassette domain-containing protein [Clostridia bacterium]